jgi:alanyl-tRNA synthetase
VSAHAAFGDRPSVVLDRTAFYPEAGGQMADRGRLGGAEVLDVQVDDAGVVHHILAGDLNDVAPVGSEVAGEIDRERRRAHMSLHTGQHMLSRALLDVAGAATVSSRLGESVCTVDVDAARLPDADVARAEELTNAVIDDDVVIRTWFPDAAELAALPLRREPKVDKEVRIVAVGDFDLSPCGGTHCTRSAQVGIVRVISVERYKGGHRLSFEAGRRARTLLGTHSSALRELGQRFSCPPVEVSQAIERLRGDLKSSRDAMKLLNERLAER